MQGLLFWLDSAINRFWMGRYLGAPGLAVHTTTVATVALIDLVYAGIATGCGVLVARSVGARDGRGLSIMASAGVVAAMAWLVIASGVAAAAWPLAEHLAKGGVAPEAVRTYLLVWVVVTVPFNVAASLASTTAVSAGLTRFAVVQGGVNIAVTALVCPLLLELGLGFAAPPISIAVAGLVNAVWLWRELKRRASERLHGDRIDRAVVVDRSLWWQIIDVGVPAQLSRLAMRIVTVAIVVYVGDAGVATLAGFGVAMAFAEVAGGACGGFSRAVQIAMAQDLGAKAPQRARQTLTVALAEGLLVPTVSVAVLFALTRPIVAAFAPDPAVIDEGVRAIRMLVWVLYPAALWQVMLAAFAAARATKRVLVVTVVAQALPLGLLVVWPGERIAGAALTMGVMYLLCFVFYLVLAVPVLWRGALSERSG